MVVVFKVGFATVVIFKVGFATVSASVLLDFAPMCVSDFCVCMMKACAMPGVREWF